MNSGYVFRHAAISATRRGVYEHYDVDLLNVIGRGASASVCRAMCRKNGKWYALKVVQRPSFRKDDFDFFSREVAILRQLKHRHICRMKQSFMSEEDRNICMYLPPLLYILFLCSYRQPSPRSRIGACRWRQPSGSRQRTHGSW